MAVDVPNGTHPTEDWSTSHLRFFTEDDRLPDYIHGNYLNVTDETYGFPIPPSQTPIPSEPSDWPAWYSSRSFRHPFLWNAGMYVKLDGTGTRGTAPLRAWMASFLQTYIDYQNMGSFPHLPSPSSFYFDTEPNVTDAGSMAAASGFGSDNSSANCVYILKQIYDSQRPAHRPAPDGHSYPNLWDGEIKVPGDPDGFNLRDAYLRDQPLFDLPLLVNGQPNMDQLRLTRVVGNETVIVSGADPDNRKIMTWWAQVCQRAADAVMYHSMYELVHSKFAAAKVGNYSTSHNDGVLRPSGLFQDQTTTCVNDATCVYLDAISRIGTHEPLGSAVAVVDSSPSCIRATDLEGGGFWHVNTTLNAGKWNSERRWGSVVQTSFGDVDSPVNYPLANDIGTWGRQRQRNLYGKKIVGTSSNVLEYRHESALRLHRLNLEASVAGYYAGQSRKLVPWINTIHPHNGSNNSAFEFSQELGLCRSKRMEEGLLFQTHPFNTQASIDAWNLNEMVIRDVYSPVITGLAYGGPVALAYTTDSVTRALVNDTLRTTAGLRQVFSVESQTNNGSPPGVTLWADLHDAFPDPGTTPPRLTRLVNDSVNHRDFLLNLECRAVKLNGDPKTNVNIVAHCRRENNTRFQLSAFDGESVISTGRNTAGEVRFSWMIPNSTRDLETARVDPSHIEIVATSRDSEAFRIEFDLVQVIPYITGGARIDGVDNTPVGWAPPGPSPTAINGTVFKDTGLLVAWTAPIEEEFRGDETPHYLRMYYSTGDPDNPLADMTCMTEQTLVKFSGEEKPRAVRIKYRPQGRVADLPGGDYQLSTFDRGGTSLHSVCRDASYRKLREALDGPIQWSPMLAAEHFTIHVPIANVSGLPTSAEGCNHGTCISDVDDGSMTNTPDGGVTIDDLLYYLILFEVGSDCADVDDGSGTGTPDSGVTIDDLLYYLERFEIGC